MPQQINLCSPLLLKQKQYFSAQTMALALAVFLVFGGGLGAAWVWSLKNSDAGFQQTMAAQSRELERLQAALQERKASAAPADPALVRQLQARHATLQQREQLLQALQTGEFRSGGGHSDRLQLVARSIPAPVWVTEIKADATHFELTGFTLEPSALNAWVDALAASPLLRGLKLATVKVESTVAAQVPVPVAAASTPAAATRAVWSFNLASAEPSAPVAAAVNTAGSNPP